MRISRTKTKYLKHNFSGIKPKSDLEVTIGQDVASTTKFKYLGLIYQSNAVLVEDETHQIQANWLKWKNHHWNAMC